MFIIATHNGRFHTDDVFAVALLLRVFPTAAIIRTRDKDILEKADICVDVGLKYEPPFLLDHHQELDFTREDGIPYAAAGLVAKTFPDIFINTRCFEYVDARLIKAIDAADNGIKLHENNYPFSMYSITNVINSFIGPDIDIQFRKAVDLADNIISSEIDRALRVIEDKPLILNAINTAKQNDPRLLILKRAAAWQFHIKKLPELQVVVFPSDFEEMWYIQAVRSFKLPLRWWGKYYEDFVNTTGILESVFCHKTGYMAGSTSMLGALQLAEQALL